MRPVPDRLVAASGPRLCPLPPPCRGRRGLLATAQHSLHMPKETPFLLCSSPVSERSPTDLPLNSASSVHIVSRQVLTRSACCWGCDAECPQHWHCLGERAVLFSEQGPILMQWLRDFRARLRAINFSQNPRKIPFDLEELL